MDLASNTEDMRWLFSFDSDDTSCNNRKFLLSLSKIVQMNAKFCFEQSKNKVHAINRDMDKCAVWDILLNISDDQFPVVQGYDQVIRDAMPEDLDWSLWFHDGHQKQINTQEILGRNYYQRDWFIYDPRLESFCCDNLSTLVAQQRKRLLKFDQCIIEHRHPRWDNSVKSDALYERNQHLYDKDCQTFSRIKSQL